MISYRKRLVRSRKEQNQVKEESTKETPGSVLMLPAGSNFVAPVNLTLTDLTFGSREDEGLPTLHLTRFDGTDEFVQGLSSIKMARGDTLRVSDPVDLTMRVL